MGHSSFGPMWPNRNSNIITLVRKDGLRLPIHRELAPLVAILMDLTEVGYGYDIRPDWTWGYAFRPIAGTSKPSNHSQGTAIDINAPVNPQSFTFQTNIPLKVREMWKAHGFRWGGDYRPPTKYDTMHFEFMQTVTDARRHAANLRSFLGASTPPAPAPRPPATGTGFAGRLKTLQGLLRVRQDGVWGPATERAALANMIGWHKNVQGNRNAALVKFLQTQGNRKFNPDQKVDGIVGPAVNHLIVVQLAQKDGLCGPAGWKKVLA